MVKCNLQYMQICQRLNSKPMRDVSYLQFSNPMPLSLKRGYKHVCNSNNQFYTQQCFCAVDTRIYIKTYEICCLNNTTIQNPIPLWLHCCYQKSKGYKLLLLYPWVVGNLSASVNIWIITASGCYHIQLTDVEFP